MGENRRLRGGARLALPEWTKEGAYVGVWRTQEARKPGAPSGAAFPGEAGPK